MKFLLDMPVSSSLLEILRSYGHEGVHAHQIGKARASDEELLALARQEERVIVTAGLDFPRLLYFFVWQLSPIF
jgi:predicted nuclease of predicted toxin-antitoxin system